ncbi:MAG: serine/threonine-protein kinase, partial [Pirellulaceae bacterium]
MNVNTCPDRESLQQFLLAKTPRPQAELLEAHLLHCDQCCALAGTIAADDELTAAIQAPAVAYGEGAVVGQAINRGKQLRSQAETSEMGETLSDKDLPQPENASDASADSPGSNLDEEIDFLAPAEQPDEMGRLGDYRVLEVLGVGGMGVVFRAEDPKLKRQVAIKAMKPAIAASRSAKERFLREAQGTASIEHDNIVQIYQVGEDRGVPFIAMQFLRGESLREYLKRENKLDPRDVLRIGREVATGLAAAHERGLIHRDIKPENIWIEEKTGRAKILDFGLVRAAGDDAGLTRTGIVVGTPKYMAPEQAHGQPVDPRCDLFSLGSVLYHLVTGKAPFEGGNVTATLMAVAQQDPEAVDRITPEIDPDLARLIMRLLSKDPNHRPQSADEVAKRIAEIERGMVTEPSAVTEQPSLAPTKSFPEIVTRSVSEDRIPARSASECAPNTSTTRKRVSESASASP